MNGTIDIDQTATDGERGLDPRAAAALLKQTEEQAKRLFDNDPPWLSLFGAAIFLVAEGGVWLAARGQHPYTNPRGPWLLSVPIAILISAVVRGTVFSRASAGISGATRRRLNATVAIGAVAVLVVYALDVALKNAGASRSIVYGIFDSCGPVLVLTAVFGSNAAWREDWPALGVAIALMLVVAGAAFAGPAGSWGVIGIGGCLVLLAHAAAKVWLQRR